MSGDILRGWGRRWDLHFMGMCKQQATMSKDPRTQVGAIAVDEDRFPRSQGFNGFPRGIEDTPERLADRETKNLLMVHGEKNVVANAARAGISLRGCVLYYVATDDTEDVWGGPPCTGCTKEILQCGIAGIVSFPPKLVSNWRADLAVAAGWLREAGLPHRIVEPPAEGEEWPWRDAARFRRAAAAA